MNGRKRANTVNGSRRDDKRARRLVVLAAVALTCCPARPPSRASVQRCVERADAERRDCARECEGSFGDALVDCHGGPNTCTGRCTTDLLTCQTAPVQRLRFCGEATENPESCRARLRKEQAACAGQSGRDSCEADARRRAAACWHACERADRPELDRCANAFHVCLDGCVPNK